MNSTKQQFVKFLKDNNVYEQYMHDFNKREDYRNYECPKNQILSKVEPLCFIDSAFSWCGTKEGHMFWLRMSYNWKQYCSNSIKEMAV